MRSRTVKLCLDSVYSRQSPRGLRSIEPTKRCVSPLPVQSNLESELDLTFYTSLRSSPTVSVPVTQVKPAKNHSATMLMESAVNLFFFFLIEPRAACSDVEPYKVFKDCKIGGSDILPQILTAGRLFIGRG